MIWSDTSLIAFGIPIHRVCYAHKIETVLVQLLPNVKQSSQPTVRLTSNSVWGCERLRSR